MTVFIPEFASSPCDVVGLAGTWLAAGGSEFLAQTDGAAQSVEAAYDDDSQLATFVNLLDLLDGGDAP